MEKQVVIMRGASGSGKSTYVRKHFSDAKVCSADFFHYDKDGNYNWKPENIGKAHAECYSSFKRALKDEKPLVVLDNTNTILKEFKPYLELARTFGYDVKVIRMTTPLNETLGRNVHNVPDETVKKMYNRVQKYPGEKLVDGSK